MENKKVIDDNTGMISCVGMFSSKNEQLIKLLIDNGYLLEVLPEINNKYTHGTRNYKIYIKEEDDGKQA